MHMGGVLCYLKVVNFNLLKSSLTSDASSSAFFRQAF